MVRPITLVRVLKMASVPTLSAVVPTLTNSAVLVGVMVLMPVACLTMLFRVVANWLKVMSFTPGLKEILL